MSDVEKKATGENTRPRVQNDGDRNRGDNRRNDGRRFDNRRGNNDRREDGGPQSKRRVYMKRKICRFCADKSLKIDYKEVDVIKRFTTEGGKIIPKRITGNCSKHQRQLSTAIKQARAIALLPYTKK